MMAANTVALTLLLAAVLYSSALVNEQQPDTSNGWLQNQNVIRVPLNSEIESWEMPLDVEITTSSGEEQCVQANEPYCLPEDPSRSISENNSCPYGELSCPNTECNSAEEPPLKDYETSFTFVTHPTSGSQPVTSSPVCGTEVNENSLVFEDPTNQSECNFSIVQPCIVLNTSSFNQGGTVSFAISPAVERSQFLNVSAFEASGQLVFSTELLWIDGKINNFTEEPQSRFTSVTLFKEFQDERDFAIVFFGNGYAIFAGGEIAMTAETSTSVPIEQMVIEFGSENYRGTIEDITMYNTTASTGDLFSRYNEVPLPKNIIKPDCDCPRAYMDTFGLMRYQRRSYRDQSRCYEASQSRYLPYKSRYSETDRGKWSIFTSSGWASDFTGDATVSIKISQPMLIYSVTGNFGAQLPKAIEVRITGPSGREGAEVYVSHDCEGEYGILSTGLPEPVKSPNPNFPDGQPQRKRRSTDEVEPKCYTMDDVFSWSSQSPSDGSGYNYYEEYYGFEESFSIPILGPNEGSLLFSDSFVGDVSIRLIGDESTSRNTSWYQVHSLAMSARPHCGGYNYTLVGAPTTMTEYYNFHKPNAKAYTCQCPQGVTGDMCESCVELPDIYRYMKEPGICADCRCSDLTRKDQQQCDENTGQCYCARNPDFDLAGRQCHWYISDIFPLYGPIAGGTKVTIEGRYFTGFDISYVVVVGDDTVLSRDPAAEGKDIKFESNSYPTVNSSVDLIVTANTTLDVGPTTKFFKFQYKPNPVLKDIEPRTTILNGGTNLTVIGEFLDSVFAPEMVVYLRQSGRIIDLFITTCEVINSTVMVCVTANMYSEALPLLDGEIATLPPAETTPETKSVTTPNESTLPEDFSTTIGFGGATGGTGSAGNRTSSLSKRSAPLGLSRNKRSPDSAEVNSNYLNENNDVDFTLGFVFDGHEPYRDLQKSDDEDLRDLSRLYVYDNPEILYFEGEEKVREYSPAQESTIMIQGERLDFGVTAEDYEIEIGVGYCRVVDLTSNEVICVPPDDQPDPKNDVFRSYKNKKVPLVKVKAGGYSKSLGYVYYRYNLWEDNLGFRIGMIVLIVIVCLLVLGAIAFLLLRRYRSKQVLSPTTETADDHGPRYIKRPGHEDEVRLWFPGRKLDASIQANVDRCRIPQERLSLGKQLGKGNFGLVYKGQLMTRSGNLRTVAVKTLKDEKEMSFEDMENFLAEGTLMIDFKHENVLSLVGVVAEEGERPLVVLPYMENGDLCTFIKREDLELLLADMLHFALQIANGMSYLAKERFVHRDLAARNCMVDGSYIVKIADFGMSRDVYEKDYYRMESMNKPLPMKWMAVESLKEGRFTSKSDVWSYGITMWELLTRGSSPYPGVNNYYIKDYVGTGKRLDKPSICPPIIYEMMCKCWEEDPDNRPIFDEISDFIGKLLKGETIPTAGSDENAGYYYSRNATKHIPDDYLDVEATDEAEDYIVPLPNSPTLPPGGADSPMFAKSNTPTPTPAKRLHIPVVNDYANTQQTVEIYE